MHIMSHGYNKKCLDTRFNTQNRMDIAVASAAVMVRPDAGLIHPGDERGPAGRAHRRSDVRLGKARALRREAVEVPRGDRLFPITGKVRRHVINDDLQHLRFRGALGSRRAGSQQQEEAGEEKSRQRQHGKRSDGVERAAGSPRRWHQSGRLTILTSRM